jgi:prevent-host-death family protein
MDSVSIRQLRNQGGEVLRRVAAGETLTVTNDGEPVAELRPLPAPSLSASELLARWRHLPNIDAAAFRRDLDELIESSL